MDLKRPMGRQQTILHSTKSAFDQFKKPSDWTDLQEKRLSATAHNLESQYMTHIGNVF